MESMQFGLPRPWELKLPPVIRYLERKYVEDFFRTGQLQLTTYQKCQEHECEIRRDAKEGKANFSLEFKQLGMSGGGMQTVGWQSYMLCTCLTESQKLSERFKVDSYFKIRNVLGFLDAISKRISGCGSGKIGACIYKDKQALERPLQFQSVPPNVDRSSDSQGLVLSPVQFEMSDEPYFIKSELFAIETEFRFIWHVPYDVDGPRIIECPEAIQFCEPDRPVSDTYQRSTNSGDIRGSILMGSSPKSD
ncbi:MAG: hypothetical protein KF778_18810 [Rhodocyclaceae bacterium]|nr:hypothetical protein [Rhodocyclaceae bacterium]